MRAARCFHFTGLLLLAAFVAITCQAESVGSISDAELAARIEAGDAPLILDVRSREEYAAGHVPGAINIPHDELSTRQTELGASTSEEIVVYCHSGRRAAAAESTLEAAGYTRVLDLEGHWKGWSSSDLPTE